MDNSLIDEISYKNTWFIAFFRKLWFVRNHRALGFIKHEFIRVYYGRYLVLFGLKKYNAIYNRIRYLISLKEVPHMFFLTITQKSNLVLMILYL